MNKVKFKTKLIKINKTKEFCFPIFYENTEIVFELDTGSEYNIASQDFIQNCIPDYEKYYSGEPLDLLCRKGFYPYEWVDSDDKLNHIGLPERKEFYSILSTGNIT